MSTPAAEKNDLVPADRKRKRVHTECRDGMVVLLNDGTEGPNEIYTYYIKVVVGPGLTKSVYKTFKNLLSQKKQYFGSVTSEGFYGLLDEDDEHFDMLMDDFTLFIETHMIHANRLGGGLTTLPDMSLVKFVVNYNTE